MKARQMEAIAREATKSHSSFKHLSTLQSGNVGPTISEVTSFSENSFQRRNPTVGKRRLTEIKSFGPKNPYTRSTPPPLPQPPNGRKFLSSPKQKQSSEKVLPQTPPPSKSGLPVQAGHEI
eukprot:CAMPEP_0185282432 /NCGR_PEP_ID=MMETSP1359-20130426/67271_1 /TAXON_ID=552665 /ORGANISM="Bigelowiella longifila, Strain CCMP242" /LENGTH=120 /DNA_ID=CAMNT_0027877977 /DNA_START=783 /DNA_END=1145 /DNA_ORIENTATION=-